MELDAFLEHGQAKGRLDVSPVEEPVEEEVGRVGGTENPQIEYLMVVYPPTRLIFNQSVRDVVNEPQKVSEKSQHSQANTIVVHLLILFIASEF